MAIDTFSGSEWSTHERKTTSMNIHFYNQYPLENYNTISQLTPSPFASTHSLDNLGPRRIQYGEYSKSTKASTTAA